MSPILSWEYITEPSQGLRASMCSSFHVHLRVSRELWWSPTPSGVHASRKLRPEAERGPPGGHSAMGTRHHRWQVNPQAKGLLLLLLCDLVTDLLVVALYSCIYLFGFIWNADGDTEKSYNWWWSSLSLRLGTQFGIATWAPPGTQVIELSPAPSQNAP